MFGHMGLKVHRGYKIFDFKRNVVARIIDPDVAPTVVQDELTGVKNAAELEFAPNIYKWDEKQRWYEEDYIIGEKRAISDKSSTDILFRLFDKEIKSCLESMLRLKSILRVETRGYLSQILEILEDTRLLDSGLNKSKIEKIKSFLSSNIKRLIEESSTETFIAFSHGDFSLVNILSTDSGIKVIDWEGAKYRGLLNDFFNFFMTEIYYDRSGIGIAEKVNALGNNILQVLEINSTPSKDQYLRSLHYYRRLYYVERVSTLLQRDITDKSLDVITKSIDIFNRFENKSHNQITARSTSHVDAV